MRIGVDCDGVICDFNHAFIKRVVKHTGRDLFPAGYEPHTWNYPEAVGYTREEVSAVWDGIKSDRVFWYSLPTYETTFNDIRDLAERIRLQHFDVYFITARPGVDAKRQTEMWLEARFAEVLGGNYRLPVPTVLITSHKGLAAQTLGLDCYIDDRLENVRDVAESSTAEPFLLDRPWNQSTDILTATRVSSVSDMLARYVAD